MRANSTNEYVTQDSGFYTENGQVKLCNSSDELFSYYDSQDHFEHGIPNYCDATLCIYPDYFAQDCDCTGITQSTETCPSGTSYVCCTPLNQNAKACYCLGHTDYATNNSAAIRDAGVSVTNGLPVCQNGTACNAAACFAPSPPPLVLPPLPPPPTPPTASPSTASPTSTPNQITPNPTTHIVTAAPITITPPSPPSPPPQPTSADPDNFTSCETIINCEYNNTKGEIYRIRNNANTLGEGECDHAYAMDVQPKYRTDDLNDGYVFIYAKTSAYGLVGSCIDYDTSSSLLYSGSSMCDARKCVYPDYANTVCDCGNQHILNAIQGSDDASGCTPSGVSQTNGGNSNCVCWRDNTLTLKWWCLDVSGMSGRYPANVTEIRNGTGCDATTCNVGPRQPRPPPPTPPLLPPPPSPPCPPTSPSPPIPPPHPDLPTSPPPSPPGSYPTAPYLVSEVLHGADGVTNFNAYRAEYVNEFMSSRSMGYDGVSGIGLGLNGDFVDESHDYFTLTLKACGIGTKKTMLKWPLTHAAGHPSHTTGWGNVDNDSDWGTYVHSVGTQINFATLEGYSSAAKLNESVLVVESPGHDMTQQTPYYISQSSTTLLGIVVRRGGILFMDDMNSALNLHFLIVESGGLFQAGTHHSDAHRFKSFLTITYEHDHWVDAGNAPITASQYSLEVLHPGVKLAPVFVTYEVNGTTVNASRQVKDFSGNSGNNFGVAKGAAVFFNGNYQLNARVPGRVPYTGTWSVNRTCGDGEHCRRDVGDTTREMQGNSSDDAAPVASSYPMTWARLGQKHNVGDQLLRLDPKDCVNGGWQVDDLVVLTAAPYQFAPEDRDRAVGAPRFWMNHPQNSASYHGNEYALEKYSRYLSGVQSENGDTGVEVVRIASVVNAQTYGLAESLKYNHDVTVEHLKNEGQTADVHVGTHAALLTRRIVVTSSLTSGGGGCNNIPSEALQPHRNGGGGRVVMNNDEAPPVYANVPHVAADVYECLKNAEPAQRLEPPNASWLFGTSHLEPGCNTMFGAEQKFRYGSAVSLDGVEMRRTGTAPNFGRLGTYGVHFHIAGYPRSFTGYLRDPTHTRELRVVSCSIWMSFARFITVHGTMETLQRNNVGFLAYGSGYFLEDGTELDNVLDHNTGIAALSTIANSYWNPAPVFSFVATDYSVMSAFWFKNNLNTMSRNLACNSPSPVLGAWYVPQITQILRGPSTVCIGSPSLDLPGTASKGVAQSQSSADLKGLDGCDISKPYASNGPSKCMDVHGTDCRCLSGHQYQPDIRSVDALRGYADCYVPTNFTFRFVEKTTEINGSGRIYGSYCNLYTSRADAPILLNAENVVYGMAGFYSEFPEMLRTDANGYMIGIDQTYSFYSCVEKYQGSGYNKFYCTQFLPVDGWNTCTDQLGQGEYMSSVYKTAYNGSDPAIDTPKNHPGVSSEQYCSTQSGATCQSNVGMENAWYTVPKIFSSLLLWRTGKSQTQIYLGAIWTKDAPPWCLGCALLMGANGSKITYTIYDDSHVPDFQFLSTQIVGGFDLTAPNPPMPGVYAVYDDLLLQGSLSLPQNTAVFTGNATLIDQSSILDLSAEGLLNDVALYENHPRYAQHVASNLPDATQAGVASLFVDASRIRSSMVPADYKDHINHTKCKTCVDYVLLDGIQFFDFATRRFTRNKVTLHYTSSARSLDNPTVSLDKHVDDDAFVCDSDTTKTCPTDTAKYLTVCDLNAPHAIARSKETGKAIVGAMIGNIFDTNAGRALGERVCTALAKVPAMLAPADADGHAYGSSSNEVVCVNRYCNKHNLTLLW
ncbi:hypothetical protein CYMTET_40126 [Cymbomonas tetramitiformis]|uniref:CEMIP beta-helix domain-containing protein n=1 Tax=Cymbomonas tetramitiformis TaxID=36881 RepID=A0AAE0C8N5_9CHLO|nr:hypothetical protein CYMTET_40126 [Cymbomonas tetramitiformis]